MNIPPPPCYLGLDQAREVLAEMGVELSSRQIKRAADPDAEGRRKLPFFVDPVEGRLGRSVEYAVLLDCREAYRLDVGPFRGRPVDGARLGMHEMQHGVRPLPRIAGEDPRAP